MEAGEIEFDVGDEALLDAKTADELINAGVAQELESVFVRELRDYAFEFHDLYVRMMDLRDVAARITYDTKTLVLAGDNVQEHVTYRTGERDTLDADVKRFEAELAALTEYRDQLQAQYDQLMKDLSLLYRTNGALMGDLTRHQYNMARSINEQTQQPEPTERAPRAATPPPSRP